MLRSGSLQGRLKEGAPGMPGRGAIPHSGMNGFRVQPQAGKYYA